MLHIVLLALKLSEDFHLKRAQIIVFLKKSVWDLEASRGIQSCMEPFDVLFWLFFKF